MADSDVLTQQEIDALLDQPPPPEPEPGAINARPYRLGREESQVPGRLALLKVVAERFSGAITESLRELFKCEVTVGGLGNATVAFSELADSVSTPAAISIFRMQPLHGLALQIIDAELVHRVVDHYFAGPGWREQADSGCLTPTEARLAERLRADLEQRWIGCWINVLPIQLERIASGENLALMNHIPIDDRLTCLTFSIQHADWQTSIRMALPAKGIAEQRELLSGVVSDADAKRVSSWRSRITASLLDAEIPLRCRIARAELRLKDILALKPGDVLDAEVPERHLAYAERVPLLAGSLGESRGRLALEVSAVQPLGDEH